MLSAEQVKIRRAIPDDAILIAQVLHESFIVFEPLYTEASFFVTTHQVTAKFSATKCFRDSYLKVRPVAAPWAHFPRPLASK
jgi:hypothetical protein